MPFLYCVLYIAAIGIASHFIGNAYPRRWFRADRFPYRSAAWEKGGQIYRKLGIQNWKDKMPDMSKICPDMFRKEVTGRPTAESLERLVQESCVAECIHAQLIICALPVIRIWPGPGGWIVWVLNALGNLVFLLIQRYNRPRFVRALQRFH